MAECEHDWFVGFYGCICSQCRRWIDFESFIAEYGQEALDKVKAERLTNG